MLRSSAGGVLGRVLVSGDEAAFVETWKTFVEWSPADGAGA